MVKMGTDVDTHDASVYSTTSPKWRRDESPWIDSAKSKEEETFGGNASPSDRTH
jgi:hypothetical protein